MRVVIDLGFRNSEQWINTDPSEYGMVAHPDGSGETTIDVMLKYMNAHPELREDAGWNIVNQLPGEMGPTTRWQRLVKVTNGPEATDQARALGLHE
jgi:hypothetical protein